MCVCVLYSSRSPRLNYSIGGPSSDVSHYCHQIGLGYLETWTQSEGLVKECYVTSEKCVFIYQSPRERGCVRVCKESNTLCYCEQNCFYNVCVLKQAKLLKIFHFDIGICLSAHTINFVVATSAVWHPICTYEQALRPRLGVCFLLCPYRPVLCNICYTQVHSRACTQTCSGELTTSGIYCMCSVGCAFVSIWLFDVQFGSDVFSAISVELFLAIVK
jgi:hypothetical protein